MRALAAFGARASCWPHSRLGSVQCEPVTVIELYRTLNWHYVYICMIVISIFVDIYIYTYISI